MKDSKFFNYKTLIILLCVMTFLSCLSTCNSCKSNSRANKNEKAIQKMSEDFDSTLKAESTKFTLQLKREGLESELRMIQSTDRRILDVNRESKIREEILAIDKELNKK